MNGYLKTFFIRGLMFGGFGPIVVGTVYLFLEFTLEDFSLSGIEIFISILSTYILAFIQAGVSVFNQIEHWPIAKSLLFHLGTLYLSYTGCYLLNSWIPFEPMFLLIFTAVFIIGYFAIWLTVFFSVRATSRHFNKRLDGGRTKRER